MLLVVVENSQLFVTTKCFSSFEFDLLFEIEWEIITVQVLIKFKVGQIQI